MEDMGTFMIMEPPPPLPLFLDDSTAWVHLPSKEGEEEESAQHEFLPVQYPTHTVFVVWGEHALEFFCKPPWLSTTIKGFENIFSEKPYRFAHIKGMNEDAPVSTTSMSTLRQPALVYNIQDFISKRKRGFQREHVMESILDFALLRKHYQEQTFGTSNLTKVVAVCPPFVVSPTMKARAAAAQCNLSFLTLQIQDTEMFPQLSNPQQFLSDLTSALEPIVSMRICNRCLIFQRKDSDGVVGYTCQSGNGGDEETSHWCCMACWTELTQQQDSHMTCLSIAHVGKQQQHPAIIQQNSSQMRWIHYAK